jgi:serine/threonine protein kinase
MTDTPPKSGPTPTTGNRLTWHGEPTPAKALPVAVPASAKAPASQDHDADLISEHRLRSGISLRYDTGEWVTTPVADEHKVGIFTPQDRYQVSGEIGRGGMGAILKVFDQDMHRPVAMKVMLETGKSTHRMRFIEEAQITGQLEHPGIVPVHELGADRRGHLYFTMKLVHGRSLSEIFKMLRSDDEKTVREFTLAKLLAILVDVANAVAFAHYRGVVHRDIKPANIMIGRFGEVLVMDWGLAKVIGAAQTPTTRRMRRKDSRAGVAEAPPKVEEDEHVTSQRISNMNTRYGTVVGTPAYMSPEQARGDTKNITSRSDIYALGALLYEVLTLTPPVRGSTAQSIIAQVITGRIDPPERRSPARAIPGELSAIAMKALSADPAQRYQTSEEFRADIELFLDGRAVSAKADTTWETIGKLLRRNRAASIAIAVATILVLIIGTAAFCINVEERHHAEREEAKARSEYQSYLAEQNAKVKAQQQAATALVFQARAAVDRKNLDDATNSVTLAETFDDQLIEAKMLRAQIALARRDYATAKERLGKLLALKPGDADGKLLLALVNRTVADKVDAGIDNEIAAQLARQGASYLASLVSYDLGKQLPMLQQNIEKDWPGSGKELVLRPDLTLSFNGNSLQKTVADLSPLKGMPLRLLSLPYLSNIADLGPLAGMPLEDLQLMHCVKIADIQPLSGLPLRYLDLRECHRISDFSALRNLKLETLVLSQCEGFDDLTLLKNMPLTVLYVDGCPKLHDLSPLIDLPLKILKVGNSEISDLSPLRRIASLRDLAIQECKCHDISSLAGLRLWSLEVTTTPRPKGLDLFRHHPTLKQINHSSVEDFWRILDSENPEHPKP